jgi:hypothetical protein
MRTAATILAELDALRSARASGALEIRVGLDVVRYKSDSEMAAAIAGLESELEQVQGTARARTIVVRSADRKGW